MSARAVHPDDAAAVAAEWSTTPGDQPWQDTEPALSIRHQVRLTLILLVVISGILVLGNVGYLAANGSDEGVLGTFSATAWDGDQDGSHIEVWGYIQLFAASAVLAVLAWSQRLLLWAAWSLLLFIVVVDDLFQVHEEAGEALVGLVNLQPALGLRAEDLGELMVWALLGAVVLVPLVIGHLKADTRARRHSTVLLGILVLLAVCAVGLDMVAILLKGHVPGPVLSLAALAETTGELIPMSLFLAYVVRMAIMPQGRSILGRSVLRRAATGTGGNAPTA